MNASVRSVIEKWYRELGFPEKYDDEFYAALELTEIDETVTGETYSSEEKDGKKKLLTLLYLCEELQCRYEEKGIPREILLDTLRDLVLWTVAWSEKEGMLCLHEQGWMKRHVTMRVFRIGRLQFSPGNAKTDIAVKGVSKGEPILEIHVPADGPMDYAQCLDSIRRAKEFYAKYYPEYSYRCITFHSWLLDASLQEILNEESNVLKFQKLFDTVKVEVSDAILRYVFDWTVTRGTLPQAVCTSGFAQRVKDRMLSGQDFYLTYGVLK